MFRRCSIVVGVGWSRSSSSTFTCSDRGHPRRSSLAFKDVNWTSHNYCLGLLQYPYSFDQGISHNHQGNTLYYWILVRGSSLVTQETPLHSDICNVPIVLDLVEMQVARICHVGISLHISSLWK